MKEYIVFTVNDGIEVLSSVNVEKGSLYPFCQVGEFRGWEVSGLYQRNKEYRLGEVSIEHVYTYNHISLLLCAMCESHGVYLSMVGNHAVVYWFKENNVVCFKRFVKYVRVSIYENRIFIQLEHGMTLISMEAILGGICVGEYAQGCMSFKVKRGFGKSYSYFYTMAVGRYL